MLLDIWLVSFEKGWHLRMVVSFLGEGLIFCVLPIADFCMMIARLWIVLRISWWKGFVCPFSGVEPRKRENTNQKVSSNCFTLLPKSPKFLFFLFPVYVVSY